MSLFARNKELGVQSFIVKLVNNNCPELKALIEGPRGDRRVNLTFPVAVIPVQRGRLLVKQAFHALTKEFSGAGVGVIFDKPQGPEEVVLGFHFDGETTFLRGNARHLDPLGGGFFLAGYKLTDVVRVHEHPELRSITF